MSASAFDPGRFFEASPHPCLVVDRHLVVAAANGACLALVRRASSEIVGRPAREAFPADADTHRRCVDSLQRVFRTGQPDTVRSLRFDLPRAEHADSGSGQRHWRLAHTPVLDAAGAVEFVLQHPIDDTGADNAVERNYLDRLDRAAEALNATEARYRSVLAAIDVGFCVIEVIFDGERRPIDYRFVETNAAFEQQTGLADAVGKTARALVPGLEQHWFDLYGRVASSGEPIRFENGSEAMGRWYDVHALRIDPPEARQVALLFNDITDRRRAELALRELNDELEARVTKALAEHRILAEIVDAADAFVHVVDLDYRWIAINQAGADEFARVFGIVPQVGDSMLDLLADQPESRAQVHAVWSRALAGEAFVEVGRFADSEAYYEMRFTPLTDPGGRVVGAFQFVYDVSERYAEQQRLRDAEEQLRQAQKMEAVGQLTGGLAHDFNNLLTGILGNLELLQLRISRGRVDDLDRFVLAAQGAGRRATSLTQRLLAFSRRQTLDPKPTDVNRLAAGMEELLRRTVGPASEIEIVGAAGLWTANIDAGQLENALLNLCLNARDAMPHGGRITIETANKWLDERAARERDLPPGQYLSICVTDTGTGIAPEIIDRVFEPFFTTKPLGEGTGLGLSMIYGFARQSNGQVRVYSELGTGTTICIYLPRYLGDTTTVEEEAAVAAAAAATGETILVIDDESTIRHLIDEVLDDAGYTVIGAADGASGIKVLQSGARIELLITDVGLPGGMNGRQVADAARVLRPGLKVLFITGYAENAAVGNGLLEPGMELLTKPFALETLASKVAHMLRASS